jgi:membrane-associated phospholipid phosphatase
MPNGSLLMKIEYTLARIVSGLFHPLLIASFGMIILLNMNTYVGATIPVQVRHFILIIIFVNTAIIPTIAIFMLKRLGLIEDVYITRRSERLLPLLITALLYIFTYYLLKKLALPSLIYYYVMGACLIVLLGLIITLRWKISLHMTSMGGLTGFLIATSLLLRANLLYVIVLSFFLSGLIGSARLRLQAHTPAQVYAGFLLGMVAMLVLYIYLRY